MRRFIAWVRTGLPEFNSFTVLLFFVWSFIYYQAFVVFWIEREPPTYIYEEAIIDPWTIYPDGVLSMSIKLVRHRPCTVIITRYINDSDGTRIDLPATIAQILKIGYESYNRQFQLPEYLSFGPAAIWITSSYACHWSHVIWPIVVTRTYDFTVTAVEKKL